MNGLPEIFSAFLSAETKKMWQQYRLPTQVEDIVKWANDVAKEALKQLGAALTAISVTCNISNQDRSRSSRIIQTCELDCCN